MSFWTKWRISFLIKIAPVNMIKWCLQSFLKDKISYIPIFLSWLFFKKLLNLKRLIFNLGEGKNYFLFPINRKIIMFLLLSCSLALLLSCSLALFPAGLRKTINCYTILYCYVPKTRQTLLIFYFQFMNVFIALNNKEVGIILKRKNIFNKR